MNDPRLPALLSITEGTESRDPRWPVVEAEMGLRFPQSYKALVEIFGASTWGGFLHVLSPFETNPHRELRCRGKDILDADRVFREEFPETVLLPLYPEVGGILPWAVTDNGDTLYFVTRGSPATWPTMIKASRGPEFEVSFLEAPLLVHILAQGKLRSSVLPVGFD